MTFDNLQPKKMNLIQAKLVVGQSDDKYEQEADLMADQVMQMPQTPPPVQRKCEECEDEQLQMKPLGKSITPIIQKHSEEEEALQIKGFDSGIIQMKSNEDNSDLSSQLSQTKGSGTKLPESANQFMSSAFGADFSGVNIHTNSKAVQMNRSLNARAFTHGSDVYFNKGEFNPDSSKGKHLLAHELTHVIQQKASPMIQRRWDEAPEGATEEDKWIERIVIEQEIPQSITMHWSDGSLETDICSTGKGHCCVPDSDPGATACSVEGSKRNGSNCTPITERNGYAIKHRDINHNGISFWSEFVPARGIAMHTYSPVDGTPLSHGCVRLNQATARRIFCNIRQNATMVQVRGFARPQCNNNNIKSGWLNDFATGGSDLSAADGDRDRSSILETRRMLNEAFGRTLTVDEIRNLTVDDIPRCGIHRNLPTAEEARVNANESTRSGDYASNNEVTIPNQILASSEFDQYLSPFTSVLSSASSLSQTRRIINTKGIELWNAATSRSQASNSDLDDRPLYWARLEMARALRQWEPSFTLSEPNRLELIRQFELVSRGMTSVRYTEDTTLKILISGFDPFGLEYKEVGGREVSAGIIQRGNPSGVVALALDGKVLTDDDVTAEIQSVIFPVRFEDFDSGMVENLFRPYMAGPDKVDMIMTISQGGDDYEVEKYAGRNRTSGDYPDNQNQTQGTDQNPVEPNGLAAGDQFLTTTLPGAIRGNSQLGVIEDTEIVERREGENHRVNMPSPNSTAVKGSGGGYLSNEIFYRAALLRDANDRLLPVGHLHLPVMPAPSGADINSTAMTNSRSVYVNTVERIIKATLPELSAPLIE